MARLAALAAGTAIVSPAQAGGEVEQHDFLFLLEEAYTQEAGEPQIALSYDYGFDSEAWTLAAEFEYGITERLQIVVEAPFSDGPNAAFDIGDVEFGADYAFLKDRGGLAPELTAGFAFVAPTGPGEGGEAERWLLEPSLRLSKLLAKGLYAHASAAAELDAGADEAATVVEWSVGGGLGWRPRERLTLTTEYLREAEAEAALPGQTREVEHFLTGSVSVEVADDVLVGAGLAQGLYGTDETQAIIKAQVEW